MDYPNALEEYVFNRENNYAYPVSLFQYENYDFDAYDNNREIKSFAEEMYELIPEEYKLKEKRLSSVLNSEYINIKDVKLNSYYFVA